MKYCYKTDGFIFQHIRIMTLPIVRLQPLPEKFLLGKNPTLRDICQNLIIQLLK